MWVRNNAPFVFVFVHNELFEVDVVSILFFAMSTTMKSGSQTRRKSNLMLKIDAIIDRCAINFALFFFWFA